MRRMQSRPVGQDSGRALSGDKVMIDDGERTWLASTTDAAPGIRKTFSVASRSDYRYSNLFIYSERRNYGRL